MSGALGEAVHLTQCANWLLVLATCQNHPQALQGTFPNWYSPR